MESKEKKTLTLEEKIVYNKELLISLQQKRENLDIQIFNLENRIKRLEYLKKQKEEKKN